jgi:hypothetical protein
MPADGRIVSASQRDCIGSLEVLRRDSDTAASQAMERARCAVAFGV